jgi:hypothetical protein
MTVSSAFIFVHTRDYGIALWIISLYTTNNCAKIFLEDQPMGSCPKMETDSNLLDFGSKLKQLDPQQGSVTFISYRSLQIF